ncbi:MAG: MFS transporter [Sphingobacteriales bacterium]|nr:MFS transporter [Sphingobacteriales bacterium]
MVKRGGNIRWQIGALLFFDYSYITSSFLLSYTIMYAVSGYLVDRWGVRRSFLIFAGGWSFANILHGFAKSVIQFSGFRFFLGATESGNFPAGVKAATEWFPMKERALAIGLLNAGSSVGAAVAAPLVSFVTIVWSWQAAFVFTGLIGFIWVYFWWKYYYSPKDHPSISKEELALIESDPVPKEPAPTTISLRKIFKMKQAWGCFIARILIDPCTYFLIFWIPKYLQEKQGMSLTDIGYFAWIPYLALAIGTVVGGVIPRKLINNGWSLDRARKTTIFTASVIIPICCILLYNSSNWAIVIIAIAGVMFGHGLWGNITITAEVFPKEIQGTLTGLGGTLGGITAILSQIAIGWIIQNISYTPVFVFVGVIYLITLAGVQLLIGKLGKVVSL